jgi:hypothetical protein
VIKRRRRREIEYSSRSRKGVAQVKWARKKAVVVVVMRR